MFASKGFNKAIYTYLSSRFLHGPREDLGRVMAEYHVDSADYRAHLLRGYARAIEQNRKVVQTNSRRFRNCLVALLTGVIAVSVGLSLLILSVGAPVEIGITVVAGLLTGRLIVHFQQEGYLVLEGQS